MKKDNFIALITAIQHQEKRNRDLTKMLEKFTEGHILCTVATELIDEIIKAMTNELNDVEHDSMISWWLFDAPAAGTNKKASFVISATGERINLETPGQLYDYLSRNPASR